MDLDRTVVTMNSLLPFAPTVAGHSLELTPETFGPLRVTPVDAHVEALHEAMDEDGYLFIPGYFDRSDVLDVRRELVRRLEYSGSLEPGTDPMDAILRSDLRLPNISSSYKTLAVGNEPMTRLLYSGRMIAFWESFLGGPVRHFDYTWVRATPPGSGTSAHTDVVFMGRGTKRLYTTWIPYGDIPVSLGGLAILERGHRIPYIVDEYGEGDVDTYCENLGEEPQDGHKDAVSLLDADAAHLRRELGGRWLTADYRAGDLLAFGMYTPHVGIDNSSENQIRLSSDSRYQLATEAVDPRWIGPEPLGHGVNAKFGLIC